jgi:UDP-GlcNAc:undecaprenyl-phosphate GlcNAc-1-phosphate transferase
MMETSYLTAGDITDRHLIAFLLGGAFLVAGGIIDDKWGLPPRFSIALPVCASLIAVAGGIGPSKITNPAGGAFEIGTALSGAISFLWLMGMIYTTKLLDGLDGLTTGIGAIGLAMIAMLALSTAFYQPDVALLALIGFASLAGFLMWNRHPAAIFLGEGGSTFIGYLLGILAIISGSKIATALLVVGIPALDILFVMYDRFRRKTSIFKTADRAHLHFRLFDAGFSHQAVVRMYYIIAVLFGLTTLIFESWQKIAALAILSAVALFVVGRLSRKTYA